MKKRKNTKLCERFCAKMALGRNVSRNFYFCLTRKAIFVSCFCFKTHKNTKATLKEVSWKGFLTVFTFRVSFFCIFSFPTHLLIKLKKFQPMLHEFHLKNTNNKQKKKKLFKIFKFRIHFILFFHFVKKEKMGSETKVLFPFFKKWKKRKQNLCFFSEIFFLLFRFF